jgi:hypothetical protein
MMKGSNLYVPSWGLVVAFSPPFGTAPSVTPVAKQSGRAAEAIGVTATQCTIIVLDAQGRSVGGLIDYTAS